MGEEEGDAPVPVGALTVELDLIDGYPDEGITVEGIVK